MKNILLPTDFSDNSWTATVYALKLYSEEKCTFHVLNSSEIKVPTTLNMSKKIVQTVQKHDKEHLLKFKEQIESTYPNKNHHIKAILSSQDLNGAIDSEIKRHDIDLVVMGTKGASGVRELLFGSNTEKIINKIEKCPILVIPENYNFIAPKNIVFPTDFTRFFAHKELRTMQELADLWDSKIRVLYIAEKAGLSEKQKLNKEILKEHLDDNDNQFHWMLKSVKVANEITSFVKDYEVNLLVMVKYKHTYFERLMKEPIIRKMGFHITIPFLVVPK